MTTGYVPSRYVPESRLENLAEENLRLNNFLNIFSQSRQHSHRALDVFVFSFVSLVEWE